MRFSLRTSRALSIATRCLIPVGIALAVVEVASAFTPAPMCASVCAAIAAREIDFTPSELRLFKDPDSGRHYWFLTYDVVNNTGRDQRFAPRIDLLIDDGTLIRQGEGVPSSVTKQLKEYLGNDLLEDQFEILGEVLQGKEHAKSGLVIFPACDLTPTELTVFVQGLSRETEKTTNPKTGELVTLRKAVRLDYLVPGEPQPIGTVNYTLEDRGWIFR